MAPNLSASVRDRIWHVMTEWWGVLGNGSIVMVWRDMKAAGKLSIKVIGESPKNIVDADGVLLVKRG